MHVVVRGERGIPLRTRRTDKPSILAVLSIPDSLAGCLSTAVGPRVAGIG